MNLNIPEPTHKRVVIIGGGFGGLKLVEQLRDSAFQTVLLDRNNYHQFQPLLYQVATAGLNAGSIAFPFRKDLRHNKDFHFRLAQVEKIIPEQKYIVTDIGLLTYDYLVIATGTTTNFYGMTPIQTSALSMKSITEATTLRTRLLSNFEKALVTEDPEKRKKLLTVAIIGGGATGVEIAGAIAEMKRYIFRKDYPELGTNALEIYLIEGSPRLLNNMSEKASEKAFRYLRDMDIRIRLNAKVTDYLNQSIIIEDGDPIPADTVIWVSGVTATLPAGLPQECIGHGGRLFVNEFNQIKNYNDIFAIGDVCLQTEDNYPKGHPQVAQTAIQQAKLLAHNLQQLSNNRPLHPFHYRDKGTLATIGRNKAVADLPRFHTSGFLAWILWMTVHLYSILAARNRLEILFNWMWSYLTYDRAIRLIFPASAPSSEQKGNKKENKPGTRH